MLAPVHIDSAIFPLAIDIGERLGKKSVSLSTGSFLSARFPFISPAGKLDSTCHFLDGGIKENSGAETSYEVYNLLQRLQAKESARARARKDTASIWDKIQFVFISLDNTGNNEPGQISKNLFELTAPISAIYNNSLSNATRADTILRRLYKPDKYYQVKPCQDLVQCDDPKLFKPILPLGWQISDCALKRLRESLSNDCNKSKMKAIVDLMKED